MATRVKHIYLHIFAKTFNTIPQKLSNNFDLVGIWTYHWHSRKITIKEVPWNKKNIKEHNIVRTKNIYTTDILTAWYDMIWYVQQHFPYFTPKIRNSGLHGFRCEPLELWRPSCFALKDCLLRAGFEPGPLSFRSDQRVATFSWPMSMNLIPQRPLKVGTCFIVYHVWSILNH